MLEQTLTEIQTDTLPFDDIFLDLSGLFGRHRIIVKLEKFHPTGSIKFKTALELMNSIDRRLPSDSRRHLVESTSGNLGLALAFLCQLRAQDFTCVVDPNTTATTLELLRFYGAKIEIVNERDASGGFLASRLGRVNHLVQNLPDAIWTNQYGNPANAQAHERFTAPAITKRFPNLDILVIGAGTCGTLLGCMRYFKGYDRTVEIVGVDAIGSTTFTTNPGKKRLLPGIGTSVRPILAEMVDELGRPEIIYASDVDAIAVCRHIARQTGVLLGASSGSAIFGALTKAEHASEDSQIVVIAPDGGEKYLDTVYNDSWVCENFGEVPEFHSVQ